TVNAAIPSAVGAETAWPAKAQSQVPAQAAGLRDGIDQAGKRGLARQCVVIALGVAAGGDAAGRQAVERGRDGLGVQAGAVDDAAGDEFYGFVAADAPQDAAAVFQHQAGQGGGTQGQQAAGGFEYALQGGHQGGAVDGAGRGR